jgi:hypothetical protein
MMNFEALQKKPRFCLCRQQAAIACEGATKQIRLEGNDIFRAQSCQESKAAIEAMSGAHLLFVSVDTV